MKKLISSIVIVSCFWVLGLAMSGEVPVNAPGSKNPAQQTTNLEVPEPQVSIIGVGDIMLGSWVMDLIKTNGVDYPFDSTRSILQDGDLTIANLEAPFSLTGKKYVDKRFIFKVPPEYAPGLVRAGIDVVTLANNHMMDFGPEALENTIKTLNDLGIAHCGAGMNSSEAFAPAILEAQGKRVAFLGFSLTFPEEFWAKSDAPGTAYPTPALFTSAIRRAKNMSDYLVVSFHWGRELVNYPRDYQIDYAHQAIELGADLVLGHHPHVLQGLEIYRNKLIAYSLGNFVFGSFSNKTVESAILTVNLNSSGLVSAQVTPINVHNSNVRFQPRLLRGAARTAVLARLNQYSLDLNQKKEIINKAGQIFPGQADLSIVEKRGN